MKKSWSAAFIALVALSIFSVTTFAGSKDEKEELGPPAGPFEGVFTGQIAGAYGSEATLTLDLIDRNQLVMGTATIGSGLQINAGRICGSATLPATSL